MPLLPLLRNDTLASNAATDMGAVLVGATVTNLVTLTTQNLTLPDSNYLTTVRLAGTATGNFTGTLGVLSATNVGGLTVFDNDQSGTVRAAVKVTKSGQSATGLSANFVDFVSTGSNGISGENLANEVDHARVYLQWVGYAPASLSGTTATTASTFINGVSTAGNLTVTNAAANDNGSNRPRLGARPKRVHATP